MVVYETLALANCGDNNEIPCIFYFLTNFFLSEKTLYNG